MRRITSAWFLLLLSMTQWIGGHLCFEVGYLREVERQMKVSEQILADFIRQETGVGEEVQIMTKEALMRSGEDHGSFVFFREMPQGKIYYTVGDKDDQVKYVTVARIPYQEKPATSHHDSLLKGLFKEFTFSEPELPPAPEARFDANIFNFTNPAGTIFKPTLLHPPDAA